MRSTRRSRVVVRLAGVLGTLCLLASLYQSARAAAYYSDEAIKAAYLYRFAGYVRWPGSQRPEAPFTIDVIGDGAVASELARLLPDHPINGHPARVRVIRRIADLGDAQMLYIGARFAGNLSSAIASVARRPVLVVTDEQRGLDDGGTINFVEVGRHVRFDVSLTAAGRAGLRISSELLSVAAHVRGDHVRSGTDCGPSFFTSEWDTGCPERAIAQAAVFGNAVMLGPGAAG
jgi:YfiR/HmsC-like